MRKDSALAYNNRLKTLNANRKNRKKEKHICPLQLDIIERLINRFTMKSELIDDPFGGLFSTAYKALQMERKAISTELNPEYYNDGLFYLKSIEYKISAPTRNYIPHYTRKERGCFE